MEVRTRRLILRLHRWVGALCALFLVLLAVTGLALNHSVPLGLHDLPVRFDWVLRHYGMALPDDLVAWPTPAGPVALLGQTLYLGARPLGPGERFDGVLWREEVGLILGDRELFLVTAEGDLIDRVALPADRAGEGRIGFFEDGGAGARWGARPYRLDADYAAWEPVREDLQPTPREAVPLSREQREALQRSYAGDGLPLYRVLLDAHAGRLFGLPGTFAMDATAVAILYLVLSGLLGWRGRQSGVVRRKGTE